MNLFVLSELHSTNNLVGWAVARDLEATLASSCNAQFMYPLKKESTDFLTQYSEAADRSDRIDLLKRYRHRLFKSWFELDALPTLGEGPNVLLVVSIMPAFLLSIFSLGRLLDQFDLRVGYLLDGFDPTQINKPPLSRLDHLFVISPELAEEMQTLFELPVSCLPLATNTLVQSHYKPQPKLIDIISYGRADEQLHTVLERHFNQSTSDRLYHHSTFAEPYLISPREHDTLLTKLLHRSKISLCFEASNVPRFRGQSPLLYRWFEGWAGGCVIVGKRPWGKGVAELMDWPDSAIEIPDDPKEWIPFFETLLANEMSLREMSQRNYRECRLRHDWRYRLWDMFQLLKLPIPTTLYREIDQLQQIVLKHDQMPLTEAGKGHRNRTVTRFTPSTTSAS